MTYLPFAILAYLLNSVAVTVDKFLLIKAIPDPLIYIFYFSLVSTLALLAIPFTQIPAMPVLILASASTLLWTAGAYLMLKALKSGQVQRVIPVIGSITPLILLVLALQENSITVIQTAAITLLVGGLVFLTLPHWRGNITKKELLLEIGSAIFFALSYHLLRLAFLKAGFLAVLVWSKPILLPLGVVILLIPALRRKILPFLSFKQNPVKKSAGIFIFGQINAAVSEILLVFSISLASPALVNSLQGVKYIFLLIFSLILGRKFPGVFAGKSGNFLGQMIGIAFIAIGLYLLAIA